MAEQRLEQSTDISWNFMTSLSCNYDTDKKNQTELVIYSLKTLKKREKKKYDHFCTEPWIFIQVFYI